MGFVRTLANSPSRIVRRQATGGRITRIFNAESRLRSGEGGGFLGIAANWGGKFLGFIGNVLGGILKFIGFSFTKLWSWIVGGVQFIYNFNWNITDQEIDNQINNLWNGVGGILGGLAGQTFGWLTCGILPSAAIFVFNEPLGAYLLKEVGEEALSELTASLNSVLQQTASRAINIGGLWLYKNIRRGLKNPNDPFGKFLRGKLGDAAIDNWGETGTDAWSFAQQVEKKVESIPNEWVREFVEEFLEEAGESCIEAGYAVAGGLDAWYAQEARQRESVLGQDRIVEVTPNREAPEESFVLAGSEELIRQQLTAMIGHHQLLENRDVGQISGLEYDDLLGRLNPLEFALVIQWFDKEHPPYESKRHRRAIKRQLTIPSVSRGKIDWRTIKDAAGAFSTGPVTCTAKLSDGRRLKLRAASESVAKNKIQRLLTLSTAEIVGPLTYQTEDYLTGDADGDTDDRRPPIVTVYPAFCTVINQQKLANTDERGRTYADGDKYRKLKARIRLYPKKEPPDTKEILRRILSGRAVTEEE